MTRNQWIGFAGTTAGLLVALVIGGLLGFLGLSALFSDLGPGETQLTRDFQTVAIFGIGGFVVGVLTRKRWYLSGVVAWGGVLLGIVSVFSGSLWGLWSYGVLSLALSLGAGYVGYRCATLVQRLITRNTTTEPKPS